MTDQPSKPPRPSRWKLYLPLAALAALGVGWSVFWHMAAGMVQTGLDDWIAQERALGRQWSCPSRSVGGYPFRLEVRCAAPSFSGRLGALEGSGSVGDVLAVAHLYSPSLIMAEVHGPLVFRTADRALDLKLAWNELRASHRIRNGGLDRDSLEIVAPVLSLAGRDVPPLTLRADEFEAHLRPNPDRAAAVAAFDLALRLTRLDAPGLDALTGLTGPMDALISATLLQTGALRGANPAQSLESWRQAGGDLEIREVKLAKGEARVEASGKLGLDEAHRLAGRIELQLTGVGPLLQRMGLANGNPALGGLIGGVLAGRPQGQAQPGVVRLPVTLERGRASIGPLRTPLMLNPLY